MAGVIKRIDYKPFSQDIYETICICANCDPEGKGGKGGFLRSVSHRDLNIDTDIKFANFCPTCGQPIDWNNIKERTNYLR